MWSVRFSHSLKERGWQGWSRIAHSTLIKTHLKPDCRKSHLSKCTKVVVLPSLHSVQHCVPFAWGHVLQSFNNQITQENTLVGVGPLNRPQRKLIPVVYNKPFQRRPGNVHRVEVVVRWRHNKKLMAIGSSNFRATLNAGYVDRW